VPAPLSTLKGATGFFVVKGIPTCFFVFNGEVKSTKVGMTSKSDFVAWLKENL
tara:strand:- start:243 stop:401 length:159 start_codon:yes stop_codon:yes gene_type:complete